MYATQPLDPASFSSFCTANRACAPARSPGRAKPLLFDLRVVVKERFEQQSLTKWAKNKGLRWLRRRPLGLGSLSQTSGPRMGDLITVCIHVTLVFLSLPLFPHSYSCETSSGCRSTQSH